MLRRTLASVFLLTLILAQAIPALCQLRCDRQMAVSSLTCHGMSMAPNQPPSQASSPCNTHPCSTEAVLLTQRSDNPDLSSRPSESPSALQPAPLRTLDSPPASSPLEPHLLCPPAPPLSHLQTALRV